MPFRNAWRRVRLPRIGPLLVDQRRREVHLSDDSCDVGDLAPPIAGGPVGVRLRVDEQPRLRTALAQRLQEQQHVRPVLGVRRRPRHREPRAEELVLGDHRIRAVHRLRRVLVELVRLVHDRRRIGGLARRPDAAIQIEIEVGGLRSARPQLRRIDEVRGERGDARLREHVPERDRPVREVEPQRRLAEERAVRLQLLGRRTFPTGECESQRDSDEDP